MVKCNSRMFYWNTAGKNPKSFLVIRRRGLFLFVYVDDIKLAGKKQNINPTWKMLIKDVDSGQPTSFFDNVYLGCTQRDCQKAKLL